jgi:hypothetical protein
MRGKKKWLIRPRHAFVLPDMSDMNDFERELEYDLHRILDPMTARPIPARRVTASGGRMKKLLGGAGAAFGLKIATGFAVAAMAATAAVAATEVAITGSVNPADWGQQVTQQVTDCKASAARLGVQGIGQCVSQFANQHGKAVSDAHKASAARENGHGNGNANGKDKSKSHGQAPTNSQNPRPVSSSDHQPTDLPNVAVHPSIPAQP